MKPIIGRIVHYVLTSDDVQRIRKQRESAGRGNPVDPGDEVPLIICHAWPNEFGPGIAGVNGQAMLDGNDALWVMSAGESAIPEPGKWHWPEREA